MKTYAHFLETADRHAAEVMGKVQLAQPRTVSDPGVRATIIDPDGVPVVLREERWRHIVSGHSELRGLVDEVARAVASPTRRLPGRSAGEGWYYLQLPPSAVSRWLKVVVRYEEQDGWIVTAFLRRSMP